MVPGAPSTCTFILSGFRPYSLVQDHIRCFGIQIKIISPPLTGLLDVTLIMGLSKCRISATYAECSVNLNVIMTKSNCRC